MIAQVVRVDHKLLGYQLAAYLDKPTSRVQIIVASIAEKDNWKMIVDAVLLSKRKAIVRKFIGFVFQQPLIIIMIHRKLTFI